MPTCWQLAVLMTFRQNIDRTRGSLLQTAFFSNQLCGLSGELAKTVSCSHLSCLTHWASILTVQELSMLAYKD